MLSLSEGTNLPSQAEEEENQPLITHFSARFHSKTRRLFQQNTPGNLPKYAGFCFQFSLLILPIVPGLHYDIYKPAYTR